MRGDANKISLHAIRAILDAAKPFDIEMAGQKIACSVSRNAPDPWPELGVQGLEAATDGPEWPASADVDCRWQGGGCVLRIECDSWGAHKRYYHQVGMRVRTRDGRRRTLVWVTAPAAIADAEDGTTVKLHVAVSTFQRKSDAPDVGQRLNDAMREALAESGLPLITASEAEVCGIEVPSGTVDPSAEVAFRRFVHLALLKLDFVERGGEAKLRGQPLIDLARWNIKAIPILSEEDEEIDEADADAVASEPSGRRYWAGGFGEPARLDEFVKGRFWQIGWARDAEQAAARRTWRRFADVKVGDWFAIKGYGGNHILNVHLVGEVATVDAERGRIELKPLGSHLYKGEAPRGADAGAWRDTLLPVTRPDVIAKVFGVQEPDVVAETHDTQPGYTDERLNLIFYGPPGTGKTHRLGEIKRLFVRSQTGQGVGENVAQLVQSLKWYEVAALVLHDRGGSATVDDLIHHAYLKEKHAGQAIPSPLRQIIWGTLGHHSVESSKTVKMKRRAGELLFDKRPDGTWFLAEPLPEDLADVAQQLRGPTESTAQNDYTFVTFHQAYGYEDFIEGIRPRVAPTEADERPTLTYALDDGVFKSAVRSAIRLAGFEGTIDEFCKLPAADRERMLDNAPPYAVFVDEINRGNVARIFGELITLLEPDKRLGAEHELIVTLPNSRTRFGVPKNLYVIGTMNTADRSVEALDAALRRRFDFEELAPQPQLLDFAIEGDIDPEVLLQTVNRRLEKLYDRDHCIGHAYLLSLKDEPTLTALRAVFKNKIIPLLQEYFFGDWGKIGLVLGRDFVGKRDVASVELASFDHDDREMLNDRPTWELKSLDTISSYSFRRIYERVEET